MAVALAKLCNNEDLKRFAVKKVKGSFYALPEWFDKDETPKANILNKVLNTGGKNIKDLLRG